MSNRVDTTM